VRGENCDFIFIQFQFENGLSKAGIFSHVSNFSLFNTCKNTKAARGNYAAV
jgi:hypothetical protein